MSLTSLRKALLFPLLIILHLLFISLSLILRIYQYFTQTPEGPTLNSNPPKHVALVLKSTPRPSRRVRNLETRALEESVRRATTWAGKSGVEELSVYNGDGLIESCRDEIIRDVMRLPISPPSSSASSPPRRRGLSDATNVDTDIDLSKDGKQEINEEVTTLTVFSPDNSGMSKPLVIHLLPSTSSSSMIPNLAKSYTSLPSSKITQQRISADVKDALQFELDPSLLIIHQLSPPSFVQAILPRPPPQISGYPFWPLRITEIYQHPTPLPLPTALIDILRPIFDRAEESSMPLIRKFARAIPRDAYGGLGLGREVYGALRREEWEGGMDAWGRVEQRLGR